MYTAKGQLDLNSTLKQYSGLVRRLAHQMIAKLPANVEIDDLIQVGMIGLTDALSRFDAAQGVQFETFATQRIRGAMLDELRGNDYLSRGTRKQQRTIEMQAAEMTKQKQIIAELKKLIIGQDDVVGQHVDRLCAADGERLLRQAPPRDRVEQHHAIASDEER